MLKRPIHSGNKEKKYKMYICHIETIMKRQWKKCEMNKFDERYVLVLQTHTIKKSEKM